MRESCEGEVSLGEFRPRILAGDRDGEFSVTPFIIASRSANLLSRSVVS